MYTLMTKAWLVYSVINGRHDSYGATTSIIGIFNTKRKAEEGAKNFISSYKGRKSISNNSVLITEIKTGQIDEVILSKVYE